jgi:hypothetical protein
MDKAVKLCDTPKEGITEHTSNRPAEYDDIDPFGHEEGHQVWLARPHRQ